MMELAHKGLLPTGQTFLVPWQISPDGRYSLDSFAISTGYVMYNFLKIQTFLKLFKYRFGFCSEKSDFSIFCGSKTEKLDTGRTLTLTLTYNVIIYIYTQSTAGPVNNLQQGRRQIFVMSSMADESLSFFEL